MLVSSSLPRAFWAEAVRTTISLIKFSPSTALKFRIPYEVWYGKPPSYNDLRVFGCVAYIHLR